MLIPLAQLEAHPLNANVMSEAMLAKLVSHIRATGLYPPIIVRPLAGGDCFQMLDGHHRAVALRRLGHTHARCEVWDVSDAQAAMLLATLNRLHGEDDPMLRGGLLAEISRELDRDELVALLPDDVERIDGLIALAQRTPLDPPPDETDLPPLPRALTFFLDHATHERVIARLSELDDDRNAALIKALGIVDHQKGAADER